MNGKDSAGLEEIRVVTIIGDSHPELLKEISGVSPRARAERLRYLAATGLTHLQDVARKSAINVENQASTPAIDSSEKVRPVARVPRQTAPPKGGVSPTRQGAAVVEIKESLGEAVQSENSADMAKTVESSAITAHPALSSFARSLMR